MADDLDQLIRAAMKTLDEQVPSGYFEALPNQTLARLEGSSMQHGSSGTTDTRDAHDVPPMSNDADPSPVSRQPRPGEERDEDSGLHDIRNLAQSTKQRMSARKITAQPFVDDVLASSSGSFKNIALPQPAKMVSLPTMDELPSKAEVVAAEKAAKKAAKESAKEAKKAEPVVSAAAVAAAAPALEAKIETPVAPSASTRQAFSLPSQQRKGGKGPLLALLGVGVAAAAGYVIFLQVNKSQDKAESSAAPATAAVEKADVAPAAGSAQTITAQPIEPTPPPAAAAPAEAPKDEAAAGAAQLATDDVKDAEAKASDKTKKPAKTTKGSSKKLETEPVKKEEQKAPDKNEKTKPVATKGGSGEEGEPSFDALLKEAGVSDQKKDTKPKLDKKSLTGDDFKKAMGAVEGKAKDCYKGTQGTALVKLTVAPSGSISKITVAGDFAGKPEASCVQSAIKGATFPPWDGGPQSFTYAVLLSD